MDFINLKLQYLAYKEEIDREIGEVVESQRFILGEKGERLEEELARFVSSPHAIAVASGTDALIITLMSLGVEKGDEVITTPFSFIATAEAIALTGARPVFADIDGESFNIDPERVKEKITSRTKGIIGVDIFGYPSDYHTLRTISEKFGLFLLQDGAQSFGAKRGISRSPSHGDVGITSFFPAKPLGCFGDGGMVFCRDGNIADKVRAIRNHGQTGRYVHHYIGKNSRLDEIQAAVLLVKGRHFEEEIATRQEKARYYDMSLPDDMVPQRISEGAVSTYAQYSILVHDRDGLSDFLAQRGIPTAVHYPVPIHLQESFSSLAHKRGDFPVTEEISGHIISLPFSAFISEYEQTLVAKALEEFQKMG